MMDSGETAQAAPKGKRRTLRQKNRILDETLESDSTDEAKSFRYKDRAHEQIFVRALFLISGSWIQGMCVYGPPSKKARGTNREVVWFRRRKQGIWMCL